MSIASFLFRRRRRALALCAASVGLHGAALWWVAPRIGAAAPHPPARLPVTVQVRLLRAPTSVAPRAASAPRPPAVRTAAPTPEAAPATEPAPGQGGAADALSGIPSEQGETVAAGGPATAVAGVVAQSSAPPARHYRVDLPPSASITLDVARTDADGTTWFGEATMAWQLAGDSYRVRVEAGLRVLIARINLVLLESEGNIGDSGFAPLTLTEKRRGRAPTTTRFNARDGLITFAAGAGGSAQQALTPAAPAAVLLAGAQDKATLPLQLAAIARGGSGQIDGAIEVQVGAERDASLYRFVVLGQELLDTRLGQLATWHLSRPPRAGAYGSRLDIWLAPGHGWLPVQISNTEASGAVTTQTATKIVVMDAGSVDAK